MDSLLVNNFSRIVRRLLSEENKDKLLGEISEQLHTINLEKKYLIISI